MNGQLKIVNCQFKKDLPGGNKSRPYGKTLWLYVGEGFTPSYKVSNDSV